MPEILRHGKEWEGVDKNLRPFRERGSGATQSTSADEGIIERVWTPVFSEEDYSPEKIALRYKDYASRSDEVSIRRMGRS